MVAEEGRGNVAPARVAVELSRADLLVCGDIAKDRAKYRNYKSGGAWQRGLLEPQVIDGIGPVTREEMSILVGSVGEYAVASVLQRSLGTCGIDSALRASGDFGVDIEAHGLTVQVKTRKRSRESSLVKVGTNRSVAACFCEWLCGASVDVLGWQWTKDIERMEREESKFGSWVNIVIGDVDLLPMRRLAVELQTWKELQCR